jgi:F-type H+-transporting ATPase subunit b
LTIHWESTVFAIIAFAILYWLLNRYAFGPLFSIMEKRKTLVIGELEQAENHRAETAQLLEEQRKAIALARQEAQEMIEQTRKITAKTADDLIQAAKNEAQRLKENAMQDIESEKNKAIAELRTEVGQLSIQIASKIIEKEVNSASQGELIDRYLKEVKMR